MSINYRDVYIIITTVRRSVGRDGSPNDGIAAVIRCLRIHQLPLGPAYSDINWISSQMFPYVTMVHNNLCEYGSIDRWILYTMRTCNYERI